MILSLVGVGLLAAGSIFLVRNQGPVSQQLGGGAQSGAWFIVLMVISLAALATTATVFSGLRLSDPAEAFGLPSGSIRALLAVGIMSLLVVFGLRAVQGDPAAVASLPKTAFAHVTVAREDLAAATERYQKQGFVVVAPNENAAGADGKPVLLALDLYERPRSSADPELGKQLITAIITLMTTVIGFYFGSRSATDGMQAADPDGKAPAPPSDLAVSLKGLSDAFAAADLPVQDGLRELARVKAVAPLADADDQAQRAQLQTQAYAGAAALDQAREKIKDALARAQSALGGLTAGGSAADARVQEAACRAALADGQAAVEAFKTAATAFAGQIEALTKATAEG